MQDDHRTAPGHRASCPGLTCVANTIECRAELTFRDSADGSADDGREGTGARRTSIADAVILARLHGAVGVDWALGQARLYGFFTDRDVALDLTAHPAGKHRSAHDTLSLQSAPLPGTASARS